jgi:hypothetical protein
VFFSLFFLCVRCFVWHSKKNATERGGATYISQRGARLSRARGLPVRQERQRVFQQLRAETLERRRLFLLLVAVAQQHSTSLRRLLGICGWRHLLAEVFDRGELATEESCGGERELDTRRLRGLGGLGEGSVCSRAGAWSKCFDAGGKICFLRDCLPRHDFQLLTLCEATSSSHLIHLRASAALRCLEHAAPPHPHHCDPSPPRRARLRVHGGHGGHGGRRRSTDTINARRSSMGFEHMGRRFHGCQRGGVERAHFQQQQHERRGREWRRLSAGRGGGGVRDVRGEPLRHHRWIRVEL